jgi:RNA polymerase sigma-70 factor (subfamily 1)
MNDAAEIQTLADQPSHCDAAALEHLLDRYRAPLLDYARRHIPTKLRGVLEPNDVLQDTFFEAFRRLNQFNPRDADSSYRWLVTIARTRIINAVKAHGAAKRGGLAQGHKLLVNGEPLVSMLAELAVYERTPSQSAIAHELAAALEQSISRLPPDYQTAIRLRYIERQNVDAIAVALGRSQRAVHMVCNRALKALRKDLRSESHFG